MENPVAIVTGSSRGIGAACAMQLGKQGYRVAVHCRGSLDAAGAVSAEIPGSAVFSYDLSDPSQCENFVKEVKEKLGSPTVLVNNAGVAIDQILPRAKTEDFDTLLQTNLRATFVMSRLAAKEMMRARTGRIINISSVVGHTGNLGQSMYAATKGGITAFTKSIAKDLARFGILANCVAPGFIGTDMTDAISEAMREETLARIPLGRLGTPDEIAGVVAFLASPAASYITGTTLHVNGGMY